MIINGFLSKLSFQDVTANSSDLKVYEQFRCFSSFSKLLIFASTEGDGCIIVDLLAFYQAAFWPKGKW
jgi:hypothetical protein